MKKAIVTTYCEWNSYGSILQAYALKTILEKLDVREQIVKTFRIPLKVKGNKNQKIIKRAAASVLKGMHRKQTKRRYRVNEAFINSNFDIKYYDGFEELNKDSINYDADIYIAGSDQIWNPGILHEEFYLKFETHEKTCISYAASMGNTNLNEKALCYFSDALQKFDGISVREKTVKKVVDEVNLAVPVNCNVDPIFLLSDDEWRKVETPRSDVFDNYILLYVLYWKKEYNTMVKKLKKVTGKKIITIVASCGRVIGDRKLYDCSVTEFLWLIDNADYVITSSFHGIAFSIAFNKKFSAVINPGAPSRFNDLLELFSIKNCEIANLNSDFNIDYSKVNLVIEEERTKGLDYLKHGIDK